MNLFISAGILISQVLFDSINSLDTAIRNTVRKKVNTVQGLLSIEGQIQTRRDVSGSVGGQFVNISNSSLDIFGSCINIISFPLGSTVTENDNIELLVGLQLFSKSFGKLRLDESQTRDSFSVGLESVVHRSRNINNKSSNLFSDGTINAVSSRNSIQNSLSVTLV
ncbi:hypothetical protein TTHERM_000426079 (macronuclear) [Tetrahymena thermophila SB210]|uniref:Uncharacterized protein n=1 Tax=Tetrahymena thermophila (strain SB210) TaxID=312017 RepID=W7X6F3_TETTS|nr:hypothetical protein TTHERM_000426079 [Tetrahymena thermophila SB210]EWS74965.1 hypothetical protein TTHERM_000426079 [Tetrahymena thermophila SB210]|eukprot:XP_012652506.1 hypothetical protein TTHERM_000426079 [Tetrahymena thermophila SB210]